MREQRLFCCKLSALTTKCTDKAMLTTEQLTEFNELGIVKLRAFSSADAGRMQEAVWAELWRKHGMQ